MPRKTHSPHPDTLVNRDAAAMSPALQHGDPYDDEDQPDPDFAAERRAAKADPLDDIRRENEMLRREMDLIKRAIPPAAPAAAAEPPEDEPDWDQMLFANPKEALALYGERVAKKVKSELRAEYQQEQGAQRFWEDFYKANPDLTEDHDLVQSTMSANLANIANLPVSEAMTRLADLTRQRIMKYSKRGGQARNTRAVVEGANAPKQPAAQVDADAEDNVTTLSSLLKARRARRRGATAA